MVPALLAKSLKANALVTATALSSELDLADFEGLITIVLDCSAQGSGITNAIKLQEAPLPGGTYTDITGGGFTSVGNAASYQQLTINSDEIGRAMKLSMTVTGGTGSGNVAATVIGKKKYI